jgi:membrane peptidoglycan carboxypeptidase
MIKKKEPKGTCHRSPQPYFCAYVMAWLEKSPQMEVLGKTPEERLKRINQGGLTIRTTLKPGMQKDAQDEIERAAPIGNKSNIGGSIVTVEPGTGKVLVMAQASDFAKYQTNLNVDQEYGGGPFGYQYGSIAKTFAVVTALQEGMPLEGKIKVPYADTKKAHTFDGDDVVNAKCGSNEPWEVTNDFPSGGKLMTLKEGLSQSINTWAAQLVIELGPCKVHELTTKLGVHMANGDPILPVISNITLGSGSSTPMAIASAYAVFASGGKYCEPYPVTSITAPDEKGKKQEIKVPGPKCEEVIDPDVAAGITWMMEETLRSGTAAGLWDVDARPAAGKTGTTEKFNQSWFVGYTRQLSTAVWIGNVKVADKNGDLYSLSGKCFGDYGCHNDVFGSTVAAPVWAKVMKDMSEGMDVKDFESPSDEIRRGDTQKWPQPTYTPPPTYTQPAPDPGDEPKPDKPKNTPPPNRDGDDD